MRLLYNARVLYRGIEHPALASPDPARLARWYAETLGFPIAWEDGKTPPAYLLRTPSGGLLEIIPAREAAAAPPRRDDPGLRHLAIQVDDFDAAYEDLRRKGVQFLAEPTSGYGNRVVFFADCDGNILHLILRGQIL